jgi:hypothetical protein
MRIYEIDGEMVVPRGSVPARTLAESAISPEVLKTMRAWIDAWDGHPPGVLVGGMALSFYSEPRYTQDMDLLFGSNGEVPDPPEGFKRHRSGAYLDKKTHVEIEFVTPETVGLPEATARRTIETASERDGLRIASMEALIALKLHAADNAKRRRRDEDDIIRMLQNHPEFDGSSMASWELSEAHLARLRECLEIARS